MLLIRLSLKMGIPIGRLTKELTRADFLLYLGAMKVEPELFFDRSGCAMAAPSKKPHKLPARQSKKPSSNKDLDAKIYAAFNLPNPAAKAS